jgi:hypothetical protein
MSVQPLALLTRREGVELLGALDYLARPVKIVLPPSFIPGDPHDDARVVAEVVDDLGPLGEEGVLPLLRERRVRELVFVAARGIIAEEGAGHVLPDQDP